MSKNERIAWLKSCTKRERDAYYQATVATGCAACKRPYTPHGPERTSLHHLSGNGFPAARLLRPVIGLCLTTCHQYGKESLHRAKTTFQQKYSTQEELLEKVEAKLEAQ